MAACNDASAPKGVPGDLTVRAYVDRDASGTFTEGDLAIQGLTVTATPGMPGSQAGAALQATTDGTGTATFADLAPGVYTVAYGASGVPAGTVLTTNPTPTVTVNYQGKAPAPEFRFVYMPATITGRIYRNDNGTAGYQQGQDTPGAGLQVLLRRNLNGTPTDTLQSAVTDSAGTYAFRLLPPGSYVVQFEKLPSFTYAEDTLQAVTVTASQTQSVDRVFTGSIIITIAQARAKPVAAAVTVRGYVTSPTGAIVSGTNSEVWIQDETGGIVAIVPTSANIPLGAYVEVSGVRRVVSGRRQIGDATTLAAVTPLGDRRIIAPALRTIAQVNDTLNGSQGTLTYVRNLRVASLGSGTSAFTVNAVDAAAPTGVATDTLRIRVTGTSTGLSRASFTVGGIYTVTGVVSYFRTSSGSTSQVQLQPRFASDVVAGDVTPIGAARPLADSTVVTVVGTVTQAPGIFTFGTGNSEIWVQDSTGGIAAAIATTAGAGIAIGDVVQVTGKMTHNAGAPQIGGSATLNASITRLAASTPIAPKVITGPQMAARTLEGQLVTLNNFTVTSVGTGTSAAFTVTGTADGATGLQIRIASAATGLARTNFTVGSTYSITGILSQFNGTAQIKPRMRTDVTP